MTILAVAIVALGTRAQVVVDVATGSSFVVRDTLPWIVGAAGDLWITTRQGTAPLPTS